MPIPTSRQSITSSNGETLVDSTSSRSGSTVVLNSNDTPVVYDGRFIRYGRRIKPVNRWLGGL